MKGDFIIIDGKYDKCAVVSSEWNEDIQNYIITNNISEIELNYAKGWKGKDLTFLKSFQDLKALTIIDWNIPDISPINTLRHLKYLKVSTYCKTEIDFSKFNVLEECILEWRNKATSLFQSKSIKRLFLNKYSGKDTSKFSEMSQLEKLSVANSPISNIEGLSNLKNLKFLGLYNLKKLESLSPLEELINLIELEINGCKTIDDVSVLSTLIKLKKLELNDIGEIISIKNLISLIDLESFLFIESTNIVDGDLSPLKSMKRLKNISFQERKHYSHKRNDF